MTTPFEKAGYTKDTKFRVLNNDAGEYGIYKGEIVQLRRDDGSSCPEFSTSDGDYEYFYLPGVEDADLEVYHEASVSEEKLPSNNNTSSPTVTITHNLTIKGYTHVLTTEEMVEVFEGLRVVMLLPEEKNND